MNQKSYHQYVFCKQIFQMLYFFINFFFRYKKQPVSSKEQQNIFISNRWTLILYCQINILSEATRCWNCQFQELNTYISLPIFILLNALSDLTISKRMFYRLSYPAIKSVFDTLQIFYPIVCIQTWQLHS